MKMATKLKPHRPSFKRFEFWTKVAKVTKPQGPFWQFTQLLMNIEVTYLTAKKLIKTTSSITV
ncbi:hypothetical protein Hanom_Chr00s000810g01663641 [Helianthus anomalus]